MNCSLALTFKRMNADASAEAIDDNGHTHRIAPAVLAASVFRSLRVGQRMEATCSTDGDIDRIALP